MAMTTASLPATHHTPAPRLASVPDVAALSIVNDEVGLHVPVAHLTKGTDTATVQGVLHLAEQQFFDHVNDSLEKVLLHGGRVHSERVIGTPLPGVLGPFRSILTTAVRARAGLVPQNKALTTADRTRVVDLSAADLRSALGTKKVYRELAGHVAAHAVLTVLGTGLFRQVEPGNADTDPTWAMIHRLREALAAEAVDIDAAESGHVTALWGAVHVHGIVAELTGHGWRLDRVTHSRAITW